MTLVVLLASAWLSQATTFSAIRPNNEGVGELMKENSYRAYQKFVEANAEDSFDPTIRLNLGLAFSVNKENDKALAEFRAAELLSGDNNDLKFKARFNQGVILAADGKVPEALGAYQAALDLKPDSLEAKTNIELLWQSQQGGKGKGKNDQKEGNEQKQDEGQGDQNKDQQNQDQGKNDQEKDKKDQPKPFDSQDMNQETMRKILDELKAQEQRVRAEHYSKGAKERPRDKDW